MTKLENLQEENKPLRDQTYRMQMENDLFKKSKNWKGGDETNLN